MRSNASSPPAAPPVVPPPIVNSSDGGHRPLLSPNAGPSQNPSPPPANQQSETSVGIFVAGKRFLKKLPPEVFVAASFLGLGLTLGLMSQERQHVQPTALIQQVPRQIDSVNTTISENTTREENEINQWADESGGTEVRSASDPFSSQASPTELVSLPATSPRFGSIASIAATDQTKSVVLTADSEAARDDDPGDPNVADEQVSHLSTKEHVTDVATATVTPDLTSSEVISQDASNSDVDHRPLAANLMGDPPVAKQATISIPKLPQSPPTCKEETCEVEMASHGTSLQWAESPAVAYKKAEEKNKLVFMIHVSGNFEIPGFT